VAEPFSFALQLPVIVLLGVVFAGWHRRGVRELPRRNTETFKTYRHEHEALRRARKAERQRRKAGRR
jgi:hypothetical protein